MNARYPRMRRCPTSRALFCGTVISLRFLRGRAERLWRKFPARYRRALLLYAAAVCALVAASFIPWGDIGAAFLLRRGQVKDLKPVVARAGELPLTYEKAVELLEAQSPAGRDSGDFPLGHAVVWCVYHPYPEDSFVKNRRQALAWSNEGAVPKTMAGKGGRCLPMAAVIRGRSDKGPLLEYKGLP